MEAFRDDPVTTRAIAEGKIVSVVAREIVHEEEVARRNALQAKADGYEGPLDPNLFPPNVFDAQGERLRGADDRPLTTPMEDRASFEYGDKGFN